MISNYRIYGINYLNSDKQFRDSIFRDKELLISVLKALFKNNDIEYAMILATSNRVEFHLLTEIENIELIIESIFNQYNLYCFDLFKSLAYKYCGADAVRHLFKVISGLDSEKLGESQIISQVRNAFHLSEEIQNHNFIHRLLNAAVRTSSTVRANTAIGEPIKSIAGIACSYIIDNFTKHDKLMFIGYDNTIKTMAVKLSEKGFTQIFMCPDSEDELPEMLLKYVISSPKNHFYNTSVVILNKEYEIDYSKECIKLVIDLNNSLLRKTHNVKYVMLKDIENDIDKMKCDKENAILLANEIIEKELIRFERQCNEDSIS